ncbi:MAG: hypothetical protein ACOYL6_17730 [Bacteriovoracaceae bacterium]
MKKSFLLSFLLLGILVSYQNCGKAVALKNESTSEASVENGYYIVVSDSNTPEPSTQVIDIAPYNDETFLAVARKAIQSYESQVTWKSFMKIFHAEASVAVSCGAVITSNTTVSGTLDCSNYTGDYGLIIYGNNVTFDGGSTKFKLIFPQGKVGILAYGNNVEVKNTEVNGVTNGMGILLYDSENGKVRGNKTNNNLIGITAYAENVTMNQVVVTGNISQNNSLFGIRVNSAWSNNKKVSSPTINNNDLSSNQHYALHVRTDNLNFDGSNNVNILTGSTNGWYLTGGTFSFQNMNINSNSTTVTKTQIFVAEANNISLSSVQLSGSGGNSAQEAYGLHAYKANNVIVNNCGFQNYNVGVKVATEGGANSNINVSAGSITNNTFAAIMIQGYDNTQLCPNINNVYYANNSVFNLWRVSGGNFCN